MTATTLAAPAPGRAARLAGHLYQLLRQRSMTPEERFLRNATDLVDLERRLRWLDRSAPIALEQLPR